PRRTSGIRGGASPRDGEAIRSDPATDRARERGRRSCPRSVRRFRHHVRGCEGTWPTLSRHRARCGLLPIVPEAALRPAARGGNCMTGRAVLTDPRKEALALLAEYHYLTTP